MSYLEFDKLQLINLAYSLKKELIRTNRAGSYASTTIINCNTRKYHGLLVCPMENLDGGNHVLLSSLDETVIQHGKEFHMAIHKYPGIYHPLGHKYIRDYGSDPIPYIIYRVGGVVLKREGLLAAEEELTMIRYTLLDAHSPTTLRLQPFLAFRNVNTLSKANMDIIKKYEKVENGIRTRMYDGYPHLYMQTSKQSDYIHAPDWYYDIEYPKEQARGYEYREDLYVPGYFELPIKKGESIVFSASLKEITTNTLKRKFDAEINKRTPRNSFEGCLENSAQQFITKNGKKTEIIAGFPWFGKWGRDTFISLPGLTLTRNDAKTCKAVLESMGSELKDCLFINKGNSEYSDTNSVDAPLWFFWAIQRYAYHTAEYQEVWKLFGKKMLKILNCYKEGTKYNIKMQENGLIYAGQEGFALTWMDAVVNGRAVTPRIGFPVEINALWYNALRFTIELAEKNNEAEIANQWKDIAALTEKSFTETFWSKEKGYLADVVNGDYKDWSIRPNQIFAASVPYSPITDELKKAMLDVVKQNLLTPRGLRTLSPEHSDYKGICEGAVYHRDEAYHQGTAWPWLLADFCEAYLKLHRKGALNLIKRLYTGFEAEMTEHGIGSISEAYNGDPPHEATGAISQAWSVAALLRIRKLIEEYEK